MQSKSLVAIAAISIDIQPATTRPIDNSFKICMHTK